jgi:hypothetical protein
MTGPLIFFGLMQVVWVVLFLLGVIDRQIESLFGRGAVKYMRWMVLPGPTLLAVFAITIDAAQSG